MLRSRLELLLVLDFHEGIGLHYSFGLGLVLADGYNYASSYI